MKLKQLQEAKLAGVRLPPMEELNQALAAYLVYGALESLREINSTDDDIEVSIDMAKDIASDNTGFAIHDLFPRIEEYIKKV